MSKLSELVALTAALLLLLPILLGLHSLSAELRLDPGCIVEESAWRIIKGKPYGWGEQGPDKFDCSGAIWWVQRHLGKPVPRTTAARYWLMASGDPVHWSEAECGAWIWWTLSPNRPFGHIGMHVDQPAFWHSGSSLGVTRAKLFPGGYWDRHFEGSRAK